MWKSEVLSWNPWSKIKEVFHKDMNTGEIVLETTANVKEITDDAKARYAMVDERAAWNTGTENDLNHVAYLPMEIWDKVRRETGVNLLTDRKALKEWVNNPDNLHFRTRPGRI